MKIGLMGGTFNPIHIGHLVLAEQVRQSYGLDRVLFIPTGDPPHKTEITHSFHRLKMVQLAISDNPYFDCSEIEIKRDGKSYTVDTIEQLMQEYDCNQMYFITGADAVMQLDTWHDPKRLAQVTRFISANRPGIDTEEMHRKANELRGQYGFQIETVEISALMLSSSEIRERVRTNQTIKYLVPSMVEQYIDMNLLYVEHLPEYEDCFAVVLKKLGDSKRLHHSISVAKTAKDLAALHGVDVKKAELAGLCHDVCKHLSNEEMVERIAEYGIRTYPCIEKNPNLAHGEVGAAFLKTNGYLQDDEILEAIRWHTYGNQNMSTLAKVIYLADIIEPTRASFPGRDEVALLSRVSLDDAILKWQEFVNFTEEDAHPGTKAMCEGILQSKKC